MITFYNQVASNLRAKNYSDHEIRAVLDEVRSHVAESGRPPEADLGTAFEYTEQFATKAQTSRFRKVMNLVFGIVFGVGGLYFLARLLWPPIDHGVSIGLWGTLGAFFVVFVVSWILSYRLPAPGPENKAPMRHDS
jgi:hypothetical protein